MRSPASRRGQCTGPAGGGCRSWVFCLVEFNGNTAPTLQVLGPQEERRTGVTSTDAGSQPADVHGRVWQCARVVCRAHGGGGLGCLLLGLRFVCGFKCQNVLPDCWQQLAAAAWYLLCWHPWLRGAMNLGGNTHFLLVNLVSQPPSSLGISKNKFSAFRYCDFLHSKYYPCNLLNISKLLETASCFTACQIPPQLPGRESAAAACST